MKVELNETWEQVKYKSYIFPVKCPTTRFQVNRVHPLMQEGAIAINKAIEPDG